MKKLIIIDPVQICGSDLIGSDIQNFGWEVQIYGIWQMHYFDSNAILWQCDAFLLSNASPAPSSQAPSIQLQKPTLV